MKHFVKSVAGLSTVLHNGDARGTAISIAEYREIMHDSESTDKKITDRLRFIEALCRNVIKGEIESYVESKKSQ